MTPALVGLGVLLAAAVKGAIGFGFPTVGTPLLSLVTDVKTAVGTVIGTRLLADLSPRTASLVLSLFILLFVAVSASGRSPRVPRASERWCHHRLGWSWG